MSFGVCCFLYPILIRSIWLARIGLVLLGSHLSVPLQVISSDFMEGRDKMGGFEDSCII